MTGVLAMCSAYSALVNNLPKQWGDFLHEIDACLQEKVELHCFGGFGLLVHGALSRPTADIDCLAIVPNHLSKHILELAGRGSPLASRHGLYLQQVGIADHPDDYEDRLQPVAPELFRHLRVFVLDVHDIVIAKMARHGPKDRADLADLGVLDPEVLRERYENNLRPYLATPETYDLTLRLWADEILERQLRREKPH